jgi:hypothetical protein
MTRLDGIQSTPAALHAGSAPEIARAADPPMAFDAFTVPPHKCANSSPTAASSANFDASGLSTQADLPIRNSLGRRFTRSYRRLWSQTPNRESLSARRHHHRASGCRPVFFEISPGWQDFVEEKRVILSNVRYWNRKQRCARFFQVARKRTTVEMESRRLLTELLPLNVNAARSLRRDKDCRKLFRNDIAGRRHQPA